MVEPLDPKEARRDDEIRADAHAWRSGDYVDRLRIERLADDVPSLLDRATTAEAEAETWKETAKSLQKSLTAAIEGQRQASAERDAALLVADQIENGCGPGVVDIIGRISGECVANRAEVERLRDALARVNELAKEDLTEPDEDGEQCKRLLWPRDVRAAAASEVSR